MTVECSNCGESFDPDRNGVVAGQDTSRCPSCGEQASANSDAGESVALSLGEDGGEVHVHIHVHRG